MRTIGVEEMLTWAYGRELPKVAADRAESRFPAPDVLGVGNGWGRVADACDLGAVVDVNRYGCVPVGDDEGDAHPDALRLGDIVAEVAIGFVVDWPEDYAPIDDWGEASPLLAAHVARARARLFAADGGDGGLRDPIDALVRRAAVLGAPGGWDGVRPAERVVQDAAGRPVWWRRIEAATRWDDAGEAIAWGPCEVDGYDRKRQRPYPDAYHKIELSPDPTETIVARLRWQIWRAALDVICARAEGAFEEHVVVPSRRTWWPWVEGRDVGARRVLMGRREVAVG